MALFFQVDEFLEELIIILFSHHLALIALLSTFDPLQLFISVFGLILKEIFGFFTIFFHFLVHADPFMLVDSSLDLFWSIVSYLVIFNRLLDLLFTLSS